MDDQLWYLSQQTRALREFRSELQGQWNDSAARDVNGRYLDPLDEAATALLESLDALQRSLGSAHASLEAAALAERAADAADERVREGLTAAQQQVPMADDQHEQFLRDQAEAQAEFGLVVQLIEQANRCCS